MMKKLTALILTLCLVYGTLSALADSAYAVLKQRIATRTGPGTNYTEPGSFLGQGDTVTVHTKVWDSRNQIWWVQVEFSYGGNRWRAYTGSWRMNVDLSRVPQERSLGTIRVTQDADVFAGPGWSYAMWNDTVYGGTTGTLLEVENGYAHIECWNSIRNKLWRVWVRLSETSAAGRYSTSDDTYPAYGGASQNTWSGSYDTSASMTGRMFRITANSGNVRSGPGAEYRELSTVHYGEYYTILDTARATNGVTWYKIDIGAQQGWISSGLTSFGKH